ncbi:MAG: hypothetical protein UHX91_02770 [Methanosphaera sp.]|jgi:hypothetical protein|nr:hypothetical protein [Methanosphaera sp.]
MLTKTIPNITKISVVSRSKNIAFKKPSLPNTPNEIGNPRKPVFIIAQAIIIVHVLTLEYPLDLQNKKEITIHIALSEKAANGNNNISVLILAVDKFTKTKDGKLTVNTILDNTLLSRDFKIFCLLRTYPKTIINVGTNIISTGVGKCLPPE